MKTMKQNCPLKSISAVMVTVMSISMASVHAETWVDPVTGYKWSYSVANNEATVTGVSPSEGDVLIPSEFGDKPVTSIGDCAFAGCIGLTSVTIPDSVTRIGLSAFDFCDGLKSVTIPQYVCTNRLDSVFGGYQSITNVVISDGVTSIGDAAFEFCYGLTSVTIPNSVTNIGDGAFFACNSLASVTIPDSVASIGGSAFFCCASLTSVTIPDSVASIGESAFTYCSGLTSVTIPNSVASIGESAFAYCSGLTSVTIPNSVKRIEYEAFYHCSNLHKAYLPNTLKGHVDHSVFERCADDFEIKYYSETALRYKMIAGDKVEFSVGLVGYAAKGLPTGLKYDAMKGLVIGTAKMPGEYETTFMKKGEENVAVVFAVRAEEVSAGCAGLLGGTFTAGVAGSVSGIPVETETETGVKSVTVAKLPAGMKYDAKTGLITGAPTKAGEYAATVTVTTKAGAKHVVTIPVAVAALPDTAVGVFNGFVKASDGTENLGTVQLTTTDAGKLTAKVVMAVGTYSFSGTCWDSVEDGVYSTVLATKKGETLTIALDSNAGWNMNQLTGEFAATGTRDARHVVARRNAFGKTWYFAADDDGTGGWTLYYAENAKAAALTVTLNADGSTKIAGKIGMHNVTASGYSDVTGLSDGVIYADFAPVVSVKDGKTTLKRGLSVRANLWFDHSNDHAEGVGSVRIMDELP